jgi:hypothetical protein
MNHLFDKEDLDDFKMVNCTVRGDHGGGKMRVILKIILRYHSSIESRSKMFQIATIDCPMDKSKILENSIIKPIGEVLKKMKQGGRLLLSKMQQIAKCF